MSKDDVKVTTTQGNDIGMWQETEHGTLCVVNVQNQPVHVAVWPHKPGEQPKGLPYAMSFDKDGALMLQLPPTPGRKDPLILPIQEVVKLVDAARDFANTTQGEHTVGHR